RVDGGLGRHDLGLALFPQHGRVVVLLRGSRFTGARAGLPRSKRSRPSTARCRFRSPGTLLIHLRDAGEECPRPARRRTQEDGRTAITLRGPCTPMVRVSSMSAVRLGPVIREMLRGGSPESASRQSSIPSRNRAEESAETWTSDASPGQSDVPPRPVWTIAPDSAGGKR